MKKALTIILIIFITGITFSVFSQVKQVSPAKSQKISKKKSKKQKPKLISLGVVNGRALNLVEPEYPESARLLNLSGKVQVEIIIDEAGYVLEAKTLKGHKLLRKASLEAAKNSKFAPFFLNEVSTRVKGIIIYNFLPNNLNWLEIGFNAIESERIKDFLPEDFIEEKNLILKMNSTDTPYDPDGFKNLVFSIENKLRTDEKNLWLFKLGITLRKLIDNQWEDEAKINSVTEIQTLIYIKPQQVSPNLISKLENLVKLNQGNTDFFNQELLSIFDKFHIFGK